MHAFTGWWLTVKWLGISVTFAYVALLLVVYGRFRHDLSRLRQGVIFTPVLGVLLSTTLPSVFESITVARFSYVFSIAIYVAGAVILATGLIQKDYRVLLKSKAESRTLTAGFLRE